MGRNKRQQLEVLDTRTQQVVMVDSNEEILTYKWLLRAQQYGIVRGFEYQPCTFELSPSVKYKCGKKEKTLFREHVYSPDFLIHLNPQYENLVQEFKLPKDNDIYIDVKGTFNLTSRSFSIDQKFVYYRYGIYIYKLIPKEFMKKFGILDEFRYTQKTHKPSKVFDGYPLIEDIFGIQCSSK